MPGTFMSRGAKPLHYSALPSALAHDIVGSKTINLADLMRVVGTCPSFAMAGDFGW